MFSVRGNWEVNRTTSGDSCAERSQACGAASSEDTSSLPGASKGTYPGAVGGGSERFTALFLRLFSAVKVGAIQYN